MLKNTLTRPKEAGDLRTSCSRLSGVSSACTEQTKGHLDVSVDAMETRQSRVNPQELGHHPGER